MDINRHIYSNLIAPLLPSRQMIFLTGPRQAGKTTLAKDLAEGYADHLYVNWDILEDRRKILKDPHFFEQMSRRGLDRPLVVFDEIHKKTQWKNYLKSCYDKSSQQFKFLCTGSGRLDLFQKGSDSLAGRYFLLHIWPFTLSELAGRSRPFPEFAEDPLQPVLKETHELYRIWGRLAERSGFPDPYLSEVPAFYALWSQTYRNQLIREDIKNASKIEKIDMLENLSYLLPSKVGGPLSMNNLAKDIGVAFETIKNWLSYLDRFFVTFRIKPWHKKVARSITKEQKLYFFDYPGIENPADRFENMVAVELLRAVSAWNESGHGPIALHYVRNRQEEEVDFLLVRKSRPWLLIETKLSDDTPSKSLIKIQRELGVAAIQLVNTPEVFQIRSSPKQSLSATVLSAPLWLAGLP